VLISIKGNVLLKYLRISFGTLKAIVIDIISWFHRATYLRIVNVLMMVATVTETSTKCRLHVFLWPLFSL